MEERVPEIRFKGFDEGWLNKKIASIFTITRGYVLPTALTNEHKTEETPYPVFSSQTKDQGLMGYYRDWLYENAITWTTDGANAGTVCYRSGKFYCTNVCGVLLSNQVKANKMIAEALNKVAKKYVSYVGNPKLMNNVMAEIDVSIPLNIHEQDKISNLFNNLDTLISLTQQKLSQLKTIKKACLEKMFPKEGETVPEIRFKGFEGPWEKKCFSDITYFSGEKNKDNLPLESYSITNEDGFVPQNEKFENGGTMRTADKSMYYIVSPQSFAYNPARINVGSIGYHNQNKNVIVSSLYEVFKTTDNVDDRFLWHWFKSNSFQHLIEQLQEGGVRLYFYYDKLCQGKIALPSVDEQHLIGSYLDRLDMILLQYQQKQGKLKNIKKALLDKMFV